MRQFLLPLLGLSLLTSACETPANPEPQPVNLIHEMGVIEYGLSEIPNEAGEEAWAARLEEEADAFEALYASTEGVMRSDWRTAAARLQEIVETTEGRSREKFEQHAAAAMLGVWLDVETAAADQQAAAADYIRTLVRHRSPETGRIVRGMEASGEAMTEDERSALAAQTLVSLAEREARFGEACRGCAMPEIAALLDDTSAPTERLRRFASLQAQ